MLFCSQKHGKILSSLLKKSFRLLIFLWCAYSTCRLRSFFTTIKSKEPRNNEVEEESKNGCHWSVEKSFYYFFRIWSLLTRSCVFAVINLLMHTYSCAFTSLVYVFVSVYLFAYLYNSA